jgi:hypothetical protein
MLATRQREDGERRAEGEEGEEEEEERRSCVAGTERVVDPHVTSVTTAADVRMLPGLAVAVRRHDVFHRNDRSA